MSRLPEPGEPAAPSMLVNVPRLITAYYTRRPDPADPAQRVVFGTSGHRGSSFDCAFNEAHVLAVTQAICQYRGREGIDGPLFLGIDTHALSEAARATALEVLAANRVDVMIDAQDGFTPTPVVSHAILSYNRNRTTGLADGIVVTPSHNPPADGGFKYNPPHGGPAESAVTKWIQDQANRLLTEELASVRRMPLERALRASTTHRHDYVGHYVEDLERVVEIDTIRHSGLRFGVDPLGGSGVQFWQAMRDRLDLPLEVVDDTVDPTFGFMTVDHDGSIRMDPSSPPAMQRLLSLKDQFDVAWGCDPDHDRHGIVTPGGGLINPNHYLAAAIDYLFINRPDWAKSMAVGKTIVTSSMIDRVAARLGRECVEVPVGFKWFVSGLLQGALGFAGEESAGATFAARDGTIWTTDKDGIVLGLLAAEMTGADGRDPAARYRQLEDELGTSFYERIDSPATPAQKAALLQLSENQVESRELAGHAITVLLTRAPGNDEPIGGLKVVTEAGWFAARPSGTEDVYKLYAESFVDREHLQRIQAEAQVIVDRAIGVDLSAP